MYGSVTDVQVFSRELTDQEMEGMTGCRLAESLVWLKYLGICFLELF